MPVILWHRDLLMRKPWCNPVPLRGPPHVPPWWVPLTVCQSFMLNVQIQHSDHLAVFSVLIDSRAPGNFIDHDTTTKLNIPTQPLQHPLRICANDGGPIGNGTFMLCIKPLLQHSPPGTHFLPHYHPCQTLHNPQFLCMDLHDPQILTKKSWNGLPIALITVCTSPTLSLLQSLWRVSKPNPPYI